MDMREKSIYEAGEMLLTERLTQNIAKIEEAFHTTPEACSIMFFEAMQTMLERVATAQEKGEKGSLRYVCISYLQSSLYTGSYLFRIDAYDERQFGDLTEACAYWTPHFIFEHMDSDIAYFRKHIGKHVLQVREHEIMHFASRYSMHYVHIAQQFVTELVKPFVAQHIPDAEGLTIMFGGYMDQAVILAEEE